MKHLIGLLLWLITWSLGAQPKIGVTLSGGGAKGLAHIGILEAIDSAGLRVDCITGTSMGSIVGSLYAVGYSGKEIEKIDRRIPLCNCPCQLRIFATHLFDLVLQRADLLRAQFQVSLQPLNRYCIATFSRLERLLKVRNLRLGFTDVVIDALKAALVVSIGRAFNYVSAKKLAARIDRIDQDTDFLQLGSCCLA